MVALCGNTQYIHPSDSVVPSHSLHDELKHSVQFRKKTANKDKPLFCFCCPCNKAFPPLITDIVPWHQGPLDRTYSL